MNTDLFQQKEKKNTLPAKQRLNKSTQKEYPNFMSEGSSGLAVFVSLVD